MKKKIKVIPVKTSNDTLMSLQISKVKTYRCNKVVKQEWTMSLVLDQALGLEDDGCLATMLSPEQIDSLIGQLVCAKAEVEMRNKQLHNNK